MLLESSLYPAVKDASGWNVFLQWGGITGVSTFEPRMQSVFRRSGRDVLPYLSIGLCFPHALLVWIVDNNRCPVKELRIAICAVSWSRISPSIMISGSWRRNVRRALPKVKPISSFNCIWFIPPGSVYSTGGLQW